MKKNVEEGDGPRQKWAMVEGVLKVDEEELELSQHRTID